jgi:hypothetical protein
VKPIARSRRLWIAALGLSAALSLTAAACSKDNAQQPPSPKPSSPSAAATSASPSPSPSPTPKPKPTPAAYDPLSGGKKVDGPVVGVKVDNVAAARPQAGVYMADMVVVERVEGNLTRLLAMYHTQWPKRIGPVRSARNTDVEFLPMFSKAPGLVFSGANHKVLLQLRHSPIRKIPRLTRDYSRPAPHNVFVDMTHVRKLPGIGKAQSIGYTFGDGAQWKSAATDGSFVIPVGVDHYGFRWTGGHYRGTWNGRAQVDENGKPVIIDNVVDLKVKYHKDTHSTSSLSYVAQTVGKGSVVVYSRGRKVGGNWQRNSTTGPMTLKDAHGRDIPLKPGHTWIMLEG